jgi:beta-galactosidase
VRLPHNAVDLELNYFDERSFQKEFGYQNADLAARICRARKSRWSLTARWPTAVVWINGQGRRRAQGRLHALRDAPDRLLKEGDNLITVKIDGSENPEIPTFGGQIDYLTYAGIYRDVWLQVTDAVFIANLKVETALTN